jgi:hypothetical protein
MYLRGAAVLAALAASGCVPPPSGYAASYQTAQAGYPYPQQYAPQYAPPAPQYAPQPYAVPAEPNVLDDPEEEQYTYNDGIPYAVYDGQQEVMIFQNGLGWGFYDPYHRWHRAPRHMWEEFEHRYPEGRGYAPPPPREFGFRPGFAPPPGRPPEHYYRQGNFEQRPPEPAFRQREEQGGHSPQFARPEEHANAPQQQRPAPPPPPQPQRQAPPPPPQRPAQTGAPCGQPGGPPRC